MMLGCFTQMPPVTAPLALNLLLNITRMLRSMNMVTELGILNMVFIPNGFSSTGGMGCKATVFYRCLTDLLATYWGQEYSQTISWLRCICPSPYFNVPYVYPWKQVFCTSSCAWATRLISGPC